MTLLTCEESPRLLRREEEATLPALHTYGTTGVLVELELRLAPKLDYEELIFSAPERDRILDWTDAAARRAAWRKRLVTLFAWPIPSYFTPLRKSLRPGEHAAFLLVDRVQADEVAASAAAAGLAGVTRQPLRSAAAALHHRLHLEPHHPLGDQARSDDHLPSGRVGPDFRGQFAELERRFPGRSSSTWNGRRAMRRMLRGRAAEGNPDPSWWAGSPWSAFAPKKG